MFDAQLQAHWQLACLAGCARTATVEAIWSTTAAKCNVLALLAGSPFPNIALGSKLASGVKLLHTHHVVSALLDHKRL